jgi:hypothetical protein
MYPIKRFVIKFVNDFRLAFYAGRSTIVFLKWVLVDFKPNLAIFLAIFEAFSRKRWVPTKEPQDPPFMFYDLPEVP